MIRLGFHYHIPADRGSDGSIRMPAYLGRFVDALAQRSDRLVCFMHSPVHADIGQIDYQIRQPNVDLVQLGPHSSLLRRVFGARSNAKVFTINRDRIDVLLLRGPSPLLPAAARAIRPLPTSLLLVGDYVSGVDDVRGSRLKKMLLRQWALMNRFEQDRIAKRSLTFVNSRPLFERLKDSVPNLIETRTTTLTKNDFHQRSDTCQDSPIRLLYAGRIDRGKGLFEIVEALSMLRKDGAQIILEIVGWVESGDPTLELAQQKAREMGIGDGLRYLGYLTVGQELFSAYRSADIYIIGSRLSEGFPRTIWEAMASGLPVVATRVGSIPEFVGNVARLVDPGDSHALANAVRDVIHNGKERRRMISEGLALARSQTLEKKVDEMIRHLEHWVEKRR